MEGPNASDKHKKWFSTLLQAFSELNGVAGNHARSYFEMSPVSVIARRTTRLASGFPLYPFEEDREVAVITEILEDDLPGSEFVLGGNIVKELSEEKQSALEAKGAKLFRTPERAFNHLSESIAGIPLPGSVALS